MIKSKEQSHAKSAFLDSPRCGAKTRKGTSCQAPAMANGRCRMHGGKSTGAPQGNKNAFKHGYYTADAIAQRKLLNQLIKKSRDLINDK